MSNIEDFIPQHIRSMGRYVPGKTVRQAEQETGIRSIKLASNENPFGPSPMAIEAIQRAASEVNWYPDADSSELREAIAAHHAVPKDSVLLAAGSSSLLYIIGRTILGPGLNAVTSELSFITYPLVVQAAGATLVKVPMRDYRYDLDGILTAIDDNTRVVFLANPNNPTGTILSVDEIDRFLDRVPSHVMVVLDEAYSHFAEYFASERGVEYSHAIQQVLAGRNVIVLRTFSKAQGLAGIRLGYGIANPELIQYFARVKVVFSVSAIAEAAGLAAMRDGAHIHKTLHNNAEGAKFLTAKLTDMGLKVLPTSANFIYVDVGEDCVAVAKRLQAEGVIIRPLGGWGAKTAIRVSIGQPEENEQFVAAMKKVMLAETRAK
ncbi:MAG TPA: histidinol-phosphate transaminase [Terriglobales bacterium]|nr:histidinol-phosphate transaminase [Terriglobales bacterium]